LKGSDLAPGHKARIGSWLLTLAGTAYREAGDTAVVRRLADSVMVLGELSYFGRDARLHHFLEGFLFQLEGRHAEAVEAYRRSLFSLTDGYTRTNLELATCLLALNRADEAIAVLRPALRGGVDGSNTYVTHTVLHEALAQAFEQAGQRDSAVAHYRMVEAAWRNADPQFEERYRRAKERSGANLM
jgi:predicted Zn-dependent protease